MKRIHLWIYSMAILAMADVLFANPIITLNQRLLSTEATLNTQAVTLGDAEVASRISDAVLVDQAILTSQRQQLDTDWGTLLIAHEMAPLSRDQLTAHEIVGLRSEGMSWNQIMTKYRISPYRLSKALQTDQGTLGVGVVGGTSGQPSGSPTIEDGGTATNGTDGTHERDPALSGNGTIDRDFDDDGSTRERRSGVSNGAAVGIERNLEASVDRLEADADRRGNGAVANRLASELGVSSELLHEQRAAFDAEWGDLLIAYTLVEQSRSGASVGRIFDMRDDGMSWFQIAKSLRVPPGRLMNLIRRGTSDLIETTIAETNGKRVNSKMAKETRRKDGTSIAARRADAKDARRADLKGTRSANGSALRQASKKEDVRTAKMGETTTVGGATKMGGATKVGGPTTKMGGGSISTMRPTTRMGGGIGGGSATRVHGAAGRGHGRR